MHGAAAVVLVVALLCLQGHGLNAAWFGHDDSMDRIREGFALLARKALSGGKTCFQIKKDLEGVVPEFLGDKIFQRMFITVCFIEEIELKERKKNGPPQHNETEPP